MSCAKTKRVWQNFMGKARKGQIKAKKIKLFSNSLISTFEIRFGFAYVLEIKEFGTIIFARPIKGQKANKRPKDNKKPILSQNSKLCFLFCNCP